MSSLTVWAFPTADGAENALALLERLQKQQLVSIADAAYVTWPEDRKKPKTKELGSLTGAGALGGGFWGLLFGLIFLVPLLGMAVGAAIGALTGSLSHVGIDEDFIATVRTRVTPGTSALFVMTDSTVLDRVAEPFRETGATLLTTNLSDEEEARLRAAFSEFPVPDRS
ncbi:DUF1269 domain-containing protein [Amycolatopsis alba]|uniref:DUF1269 domain-containing protein n=1 Tax=Amycolatopsis alba DSM 44262 TaxID=1125972 RepID=A0A229RPK9_AMYAL|nr:DUF1269 domain-containing protein [Amycolatopsis alba]OXM48596.1 DUF1269 domain-containing protein [Amycolatopsis alba DSM 44262]